jgi:hypothetical protein
MSQRQKAAELVARKIVGHYLRYVGEDEEGFYEGKLVDAITDAILARERAAAERMRERAAWAVRTELNLDRQGLINAIRALPVDPEPGSHT